MTKLQQHTKVNATIIAQKIPAFCRVEIANGMGEMGGECDGEGEGSVMGEREGSVMGERGGECDGGEGRGV